MWEAPDSTKQVLLADGHWNRADNFSHPQIYGEEYVDWGSTVAFWHRRATAANFITWDGSAKAGAYFQFDDNREGSDSTRDLYFAYPGENPKTQHFPHWCYEARPWESDPNWPPEH